MQPESIEEIFIARAQTYVALGDYFTAAKELKKLYNRNRDPHILWITGVLYERMGDEEKQALQNRAIMYKTALETQKEAVKAITGRAGRIHHLEKRLGDIERQLKGLHTIFESESL